MLTLHSNFSMTFTLTQAKSASEPLAVKSSPWTIKDRSLVPCAKLHEHPSPVLKPMPLRKPVWVAVQFLAAPLVP